MSYLFDDIKEGKNRKSAPIINSNFNATKEQTKTNITTIENIAKTNLAPKFNILPKS